VERAVPPYLQIAGTIRADIESGTLAEGERIPSAREIVATWGVALATATKVHARLRSEGLIRSVPGVGSVVSTGQRAIGGGQLLASTRARGRVYVLGDRAEVRSSEVVPAPENVAVALGVEEGSPVVRRERVIDRDGASVSVSVSWLPGEHVGRAPRLLSTERIPEGTFAYLASVLGLELTGGHEQASAARASAVEASALGVEEGSPVQLTRTWFLAAEDNVIEYGEAVHPGGYWLSHEFTID
jgi:DNA-binding GntR family transcriptional regulator